MVFMSLAEGKSSIVCKELSLHSQTMLKLLEIFMQDSVKIDVNEI